MAVGAEEVDGKKAKKSVWRLRSSMGSKAVGVARFGSGSEVGI